MINGVFLIDKDCQTTSRKLDNQVGRKFSIKKVGHVGTLDPLATGLMLVAVNEGTKAIPYMEDSSKEYIATFKLGLLTTTLDLEGEVVRDDVVKEFSKDDLLATIDSFLGKITQIPPLTSAIKVDGVPLYKYAHAKIDFDVPPRIVEIFSIELLDYQHPNFTIKTSVSSGTYIRTLGNDIAHKLHTVATTINLRRTKVGNFKIEDAKKLENVESFDIINIDKFLAHIPTVILDENQGKLALVGAQILLESDEERVQVIYDGKLLAIYQKIEEQAYKCLRGFNL
ncbi:MAG TPA: tRNA pseudouridine(55) synthase TruB [Bacilli bacterium]|nr:tRNA pseudouridine(55) synthase TruB [Bacilli bacterium]